MKRLLRRYWRYLVSAAALILLVRFVGSAELIAALRSPRPAPLLGYLVGLAAAPLLLGVEIWVALRLTDRRIALRRVLAASVGAWSVGTLTPARAGDLSLAYFLRPEVRGAETLAIVVLDKLVSVGALALLALLGAAWVGAAHRGTFVGAAAVVLVAVPLIVVAVGIGGGTELPRRLAGRFLGGQPLDALDALRALLRRSSVFLWLTVASLGRWLYLCAINLLIFRALGEHPGFGHVVAATSIGRIISLLPVTAGGVGLKEPVQIPIYADAGVGAEAVVAVSILGMACVLGIAAIYPLLIRSGARAAAEARGTE